MYELNSSRIGGVSESKLTPEFLDFLKKERVGAKVINVENNRQFSRVIIFERTSSLKKESGERFVRVYRGINHLDSSVFRQTPYALRLESASGNSKILEEIEQGVNNLSQNPTYENLLRYVEKVRPLLPASILERLNEDLKDIEDGILNGSSTRSMLAIKQIAHGGGFSEWGLSPYVSASLNPHQAAEYARGGILIIDVPMSKIEILAPDSSEVFIKGSVGLENISGVLLRNTFVHEEYHQEIDLALEKFNQNASLSVYDSSKLSDVLVRKTNDENQLDKQRWERDVSMVRERRTKILISKFPEVGLTIKNLESSDIYKEAKERIFLFYKERLEKLGYKLEDFDYYDHGQIRKFDIEKVDDFMLLSLRQQVLHLEERNKKYQDLRKQ